MPHDHHPHDGHSQYHHDHPATGHNHAEADHLHSHMHDHDEAADLQILTDQFIDGFVAAKDKMAYLRIAGVPLDLADKAGGPALKLVDVHLSTEWQVGTASPSFGSSELSYLPYPGEMVTERTNMGFVYVSLKAKDTVDLRGFIAGKARPD
ncbi:hypothetical protein [Roseobacter sp.]|uniref:hypothetical protein n=1 Tax=Roseobacter sp. TaxID=1907202 RepID=UPI0025E8FF1F|nr:hypothetical protein [Roseobacter sp.]